MRVQKSGDPVMLVKMGIQHRKGRDRTAYPQPNSCGCERYLSKRAHAREYAPPACDFLAVPAATIKLTHYPNPKLYCKTTFASVPLILTFVKALAATRYECQNRNTSAC